MTGLRWAPPGAHCQNYTIMQAADYLADKKGVEDIVRLVAKLVLDEQVAHSGPGSASMSSSMELQCRQKQDGETDVMVCYLR